MLSVSPLTVGFGSVSVGSTSNSMSVTVTNTGAGMSGQITPTVTGSAAGDYAVDTNGCTTLAAGANCAITVTFTPSMPGDRPASLVIAATPGGSVTSALDGTGLAPGSITINPMSKGFGNEVVGTATATQTFTITNPGGTATGSLTASLTGNDSSEFAISNDTCTGQALAAAATCTIDVAFSPQSAGPKTASLSVTGTPGGTVTADLSGTGQAPAKIVVLPDLQNFGSVVSGQSSSNVSFTVSNTGDVATGTLAQSVTGTNASDFVVVSSNCNGATLAHLATCTVVIKFSPTTMSDESASLELTGTPGGTGTSVLSGTGIAPGQIAFTGAALPPLSFGNVTVGQTSASQTLTITNTGSAPTGSLSTALGGTNPSEFTIVAGSNGCQGTVLAASASCTIAVQFAPASGGAKSANLVISGSPGGSISAQLGGNGIPAAHLSIDRASKDYGSVGVGENSPAQAFVITNDGGQTSGAVSVALNGANSTQFDITSTDCTGAALDPGKTCTVNVRFSPTAQGNYTASLDVSATPGGTVSSNLFGIGVTPADITVTSADGDGTFGTIGLIGDAAQVEHFTVTNNGAEPTGTIMVSTSGSSEFTQTNTCTTLLQNASCTITLSFTATTVGSATGQLSVTASPGGSVTKALTGSAKHRLEITAVTGDGSGDTSAWTFPSTVVNTATPSSIRIVVTNNTTTAQTVTENSQATPFTFDSEGNGCLDAMGNPVQLAAATAPGVNGGSCTATIDFDPASVGSFGPRAVTFSIAAGANNQATENVSGKGVNSLQISPATNPFGAVAVGTTSPTMRYTISNPNGAPASGPISVSLTTGPFHIVNNACAGLQLNGSSSCSIDVAFTPTTQGTAPTATLTATATPGGTVTATATGSGAAQASVAITGSPDFGAVFAGTASAAKTFTVTNNGGVDTTLDAPTITGSTAGGSTFTRTGGTCVSSGTQTLKPGAANACTVIGTFTPGDGDIGAATAPSGTLTVHDAISGTHTLTLTGTAESTISMTGNADFGSVVAGSTATRTFTVKNNSTEMVSVSSVTTGSGNFVILNNTCTGMISTCSFDVRFTAPTPMGGAATEAESANLNVTATHGAATQALTATALGLAKLQITPATADYGSALEGTSGITQTYTVQNVGGQASGAVSVTLSGSNFSITTNNCSGSLAGQTGTCSVTVQFTPPIGSTTMDGTLMATASPGGTATATAHGVVIPSGGVTVTPVTGDFSSVEDGVATGTTRDFTVQNTSSTTSASLSVSTDDSAGGGRYTLVTGTGNDCGSTLAAGGSCTVRVRFTPQGSNPGGDRGTITGHLWIQGAGSGAYANLQGTALLPPGVNITINLAGTGGEGGGGAGCSGTNCTIDFPVTGDGFTSSATVTLTNNGDVPSGSAVISALAGNDPTQFSIPAGTNGCQGKTLTATGTAGASCSFVVNFAPTQVDGRTANFTVSVTPGLASTSFSLFGYALAPSSLAFEPSSQSAGSLPVGSTTSVQFQVINSFAAASGPMTFALSDSTDFAIDTSNFSGNCDPGGNGIALDIESSCILRVIFKPQTPTANLSTTISVTANPGATTPVTATLTGSGTSAITVDNTAPTLSAPEGGESSIETLTFTNNASVPTGVLDTVLAGTNPGQFTIMSDGCVGTVLDAAGGTNNSCQVNVIFIPSGSTNASATLTVSGTPGNSATSTLTGMIVTP